MTVRELIAWLGELNEDWQDAQVYVVAGEDAGQVGWEQLTEEFIDLSEGGVHPDGSSHPHTVGLGLVED